MKRALLERGATPSSIEVFFRVNTKSSFASALTVLHPVSQYERVLKSLTMTSFTSVHYATYEAAVLGFGSGGTELGRIRKALAKVRPKPSPIGSLKVNFGALGVKKDPRTEGWIIRYFFAGTHRILVLTIVFRVG